MIAIIDYGMGNMGSPVSMAKIYDSQDADEKVSINTAAVENPVFVQEASEKFGRQCIVISIDKEGTMTGYDLELVRMVQDSVSIPVIANGGAGTRQHFVDAVREGHAHAVAASSVFHFSDSNIMQVKSFLFNAGIPVRTHAS